MKDRSTQKGVDSLFYILGCLATFGSLWLIRIAITKGIQYANEQKTSE